MAYTHKEETNLMVYTHKEETNLNLETLSIHSLHDIFSYKN